MATTTHLHMSLPEATVAQGSYVPPEWLHVIPAGEFRGIDGRGPFVVGDAAELVRLSLQEAGGKLLLDENHVTDLGRPLGASARAVAWMTQLEVRKDGIWAKPKWTKHGRALMADESYRGISPVIVSEKDADGREVVTRLMRASLTNTPNLILTTLHNQQETAGMDLAKIRRALGLAADASDQVVEQAIIDRAAPALSLHTQVAGLVGVDQGTASAALMTALQARIGAAGEVTTQLHSLQTEVQTLRTRIATDEATRVVDEAARTRVVSADLRGQLITLHATNPALVTTLIAGLPDLKTGSLSLHSEKRPDGTLTSDEEKLAAALGIKPEDLAKARGVTV